MGPRSPSWCSPPPALITSGRFRRERAAHPHPARWRLGRAATPTGVLSLSGSGEEALEALEGLGHVGPSEPDPEVVAGVVEDGAGQQHDSFFAGEVLGEQV